MQTLLAQARHFHHGSSVASSPAEVVVLIVAVVIIVAVLIALKHHERLRRVRLFRNNTWQRARTGFGRRGAGPGYKPFGGGAEPHGFFSSWR
jgi:hypothetical protein